MLKPLHKINFIIEYEHEYFPVQTFWGEYRDLRELIADLFYPEDFGQCGGMGRCATCMVELHGLEVHASMLKRNEQTTLARQDTAGRSIRLSCQLPVDDDLANTHIRIL